MADSSISTTDQPAVSIILPTYNRETFLPDAFAAIAAQTFPDWELIVVDDGSTDNTREAVPRNTGAFAQPVRYIYQENQGAYGARNTGLDQARGKYIAFYDSDDLWLPHHLQDCVEGLEANPDVDWVYGTCEVVDHQTGEVLRASTFDPIDGTNGPSQLNTRVRGKLHIFDDAKLLDCVLSCGLRAGLQNSVIRCNVFAHNRFDIQFKNECEDALFVARAALAGHGIGYIPAVHVTYRRHDTHSSAAGAADLEKRESVLTAMLAACEEFYENELHDRRLRRVFRRTMASHYFWKLGYATYWAGGRTRPALSAFRRGLQLYPWNLLYWKTYLTSLIKAPLSNSGE